MNTIRHQNPVRPGASAQVWDRPFYKNHKSWCDDFVLELRLMDVPGDVIGERLAEVETYCAESGEAPQEAFGDPTIYAKAVGAQSREETATGVWKSAALGVGQVLAFLVGTRAAGVWAAGERVAYNAVQVLCLVLAAAVLALLPGVVRAIVHRPVLVGVPYLVAFTALAMGATLAQGLDLPALITAPAALVTVWMFMIILVLGWLVYRNLSTAQDQVTSPLSRVDGPAAVDANGSRGSRRAALWVVVVFPVFYIILSVVSWLTA